ncbi:hypothetical protein RI054_05g25300 [Pseudoscourfieldia marina]
MAMSGMHVLARSLALGRATPLRNAVRMLSSSATVMSDKAPLSADEVNKMFTANPIEDALKEMRTATAGYQAFFKAVAKIPFPFGKQNDAKVVGDYVEATWQAQQSTGAPPMAEAFKAKADDAAVGETTNPYGSVRTYINLMLTPGVNSTPKPNWGSGPASSTPVEDPLKAKVLELIDEIEEEYDCELFLGTEEYVEFNERLTKLLTDTYGAQTVTDFANKENYDKLFHKKAVEAEVKGVNEKIEAEHKVIQEEHKEWAGKPVDYATIEKTYQSVLKSQGFL